MRSPERFVDPEAEPDIDRHARTRLDKWLWHARFFRTRGLAAQMVASGKVRINARLVKKPGTAVRPGDILTIVQGGDVRVVRVTGIAVRRGPAQEAQALYAEDDGQG